MNASIAELSENADSKFVTICHGEPWSGNIQYRYSSYIVVDSSSNQENTKDGEGKSPVEAVFGGIDLILFRAYIERNNVNKMKKYLNEQSIYSITGFHSCTIGKGGYDLAHFLLTSTTREFRTQNLELVLKAYLSELDDVIGSQGNISLVTNRTHY